MQQPIQLLIPNPTEVFNDQTLETLYRYDDELEVYYGGASSGKSHGVYQKFVLKCLQPWSKPRRMVVWRKVNATLRDSSYQHVKDVIDQFGLTPYCDFNKTELMITIRPTKAQILFKGLDEAEKIKSLKGVSDQILEEATEFTLDDFTQLTLRVRDKEHRQRQTALMFNPISKLNWVYPYFFVNKDHGAKIYQSTYLDNRFLDEKVKQGIEALKLRNPAYYRIYALGEFATLDKLALPNHTIRLISQEEVKDLPLLVGLDFGYVNDASALVNVRYDVANRRVYIVSEYVKKGMLNDEIARVITNLGLHKEVIHADSAEQKSIEEIRQYGVDRITPASKGAGSILHGIQWLGQQEIIVDERCPHTISELQNYTWVKDKKTGEYDGNKLIDTYNHTIDAIRYSLEDYISGTGQVTIYNADDLGYI